ncbi:MAG: tetratricopeptide repeat protein [Saprospiraceae bacterium]|nr:tetratricopeptide repeat protein [Saprospiraceae bacterium]
MKSLFFIPLLLCCATLSATNPDSLRQLLSQRQGAARLPVLVRLCGVEFDGMLPKADALAFAEEILRLAPLSRDTAAWVNGCLCAATNADKASDNAQVETWLKLAQQLAVHRPALMVEVLAVQSDFLMDLGQIDSVLANLSLALLLCKTNKLLSRQSNLTGGMAKVYSEMGKAGKADSLGRLAFMLCQNQRDSADAFRRWGGTQKNLGHTDEAIRAFLEGYRIEKKLGNPVQAAFNLHQTATILRDQGRYEQAIRQFEEVVRLTKPLNYSLGLARAYNSLGSLYFETNEYDKALYNFRQSLSLKKEMGSPKKILTTISNMAELYLHTEQYDSCLALCEAYLPLSQKSNTSRLRPTCLFWGNGCRQNKHPALARRYLAVGEKAIGKVKNTEEMPSVYQFAAQGYALLGDYDNAYHYQVLYQTAQETNFNKEKSRIISEVEAEFETEKKEQQIAVLGKENELQNARIASDRNRLLALLGGLGLVGTLAFAFWRNSSARKRHNEVLSQTNDQLNRKNHEVETLLREIHHRVKNNLQIISSLLRMQARRVSDEHTLEALRTGQARVRSMALLHQRLYQGDQLKEIPMHPYLTDLAQSLMDAYQVDEERIQLRLDLDNDISLDVDTAVPLGLIANELLTNSLKYAFPDERSGCLILSLKKAGDAARLEVSDDGVGFQLSDGKPPTSRSSFGLELVESLAQKIKATPVYSSGMGAKTVLLIPV